MTVSNSTRSQVFTTDAVTTAFVFTFRIPDASYLVVTHIPTASAPVAITSYTLTIAGSYNGGAVTISPALAAGRLIVERVVPRTQSTNFRTQGAFYPQTHEEALDLLTMALQLIEEDGLTKSTQAFTGDAEITTIGKSFIALTNTSGTNALTLQPPTADGRRLVLFCTVPTNGTFSIADAPGTTFADLSAAWAPTAGDTLSLISYGGVWYETARSAN